MPSDSSLMTVVPDTAEFGVETEYARDSANLLGMGMEEVQVHERSYVELLEAVIDETARPPVHDVIPFLAEGYHAVHGSAFVLGEGADGTIGTGGRPAKIGNFFRQRHLRAAALGIAGVAPQSIRFRAQAVIGRGASLASDPLGSGGYAAAAQIYGDPGFIKSVVGPDRVEAVILEGLQYVFDRVDLVAPDDPFVRQIEARQWRGMFDDHIRIDSEIARAHGTSVFAPFIMSETVSAVTRIPIADRHHKGFMGKWLLKHLLAQRLPEYDVGKRKRHTGLPFTRFCTDGPLTDIWDRYSVPDLFEGEDREKLVANTLDEAVLWNAIAYAMWDERVVRNAGLTPNTPAAFVSIDLIPTA
jgi:asparagine synthetase B (glutamine-hydrolysing)